MCGIVGMVGDDLKVEDVVNALEKLEYRGYDSAGVAYLFEGSLKVHKSVGKISRLKDELGPVMKDPINVGIAHTRWATHGPPNLINAHPHTDCKGSIALVHNGIVENYKELREYLRGNGHEFVSETDTEVIAHLIEEEYDGDLLNTVVRAVQKLDGAYAIGVIHVNHPEELVVARKGSPLVVGLSKDVSVVASDVTPILRYTKDVIFLEDGDVALIRRGHIRVENSGVEVERKLHRIEWDESVAERSGYKHFMIKEIMEEPSTLRNAMMGRMRGDEVFFPELKNLDFSSYNGLNVVACGTSYHAALFFKYFVEMHTDVVVQVDVASEFRYRKPHVGSDYITLAISQSGETADTLESIRLMKKLGSPIVSITNVLGSTITRESDVSIMMNAGPEIGVAATKTYVSQLVILTLLGLKIIKDRGFWKDRHSRILDTLLKLPEIFENVLQADGKIEDLAKKYSKYNHFMYIGRGYGYPTALEGALKLKEISYIHAEGYPAGELKHGPIALLDENFPVFAISPRDSMYTKMRNNIMECKSRNAKVIVLTDSDEEDLLKSVDDMITVPKMPEDLYPLVMAPVIQLFAYHVSDLKGLNPDRPRNLAKSVTVE